MPPKSTCEHQGFHEETKYEMNEFRSRQRGFTKLQQTSGGGAGTGAGNQFLEDPRDDSGSGSGSNCRTTKPPRDSTSQFLKNVNNRHFDRVLTSPSEAQSMNTLERHHYKEQGYVDHDQKNKFESDGVSAASSATTPTSVGYSSLSGPRIQDGGDASGSASNGRNTRARRDPRPQFWQNVKKRHLDDVLAPPSHADSLNSWKRIHYGEQHYDDDNKKYERESYELLNPIKKRTRYERFYSGGTGKGKEKNENVVGEGGANEIEETRKRPRLNWGDGLAKFEKKKTEAEAVSATSAVAPTPTSIACSSLSGAADIVHAKTTTGDNNEFHILSTSVVKLLESTDLSSSVGRSNAMTKVLIWKTIISKVLEEIETEIGSLENELKTVLSEPKSSHNPETLQITPSGDDENIDKRPLSPNLDDSTENTLCREIISCNRETVKRSCAVFDKFLPTECRKIVWSSSLSDENAVLKEKFAEKEWFGRFKEEVLTIKYKAFEHLWKKDMLLRSLRKNPPTSYSNFGSSLRTISNDCVRNRSSYRHRFRFPVGNNLSLVPTSEMINFTKQLLSESRNEVKRSILKTPSLILDEKDKMISMFESRNGMIEDPVAAEKERAMINPWTLEEKEIYFEKFAAFGKDFRKIASFLDHKTTADCVEFYYKTHKPNCFEKDKKRKSGKSEKLRAAKTGGKRNKLSAVKTGLKASGRKRNSKVNVNSQKKLNEPPLKKRGIACNRRTRSGRLYLWRRNDKRISTDDDSITPGSNSNNLGFVPDERETVVAHALVGLCDSLPSKATSSFITNSVDPVEARRDTTCLNVSPQLHQNVTPDVTQDMDDKTSSHKSCDEVDLSEWTDEEKEAFFKAVSSFGEDFEMIAQCLGTRSIDECKRFFIKGQKYPSLDLMHHILEYVGYPVNEVNSAREVVNVVEENSEGGNEKSEQDTNKNKEKRNLNHEESKPVEGENVSEPTEITSMVSNEYIIIQNIMEEGHEATKFVPIVEFPVNDVNVVGANYDTNKYEDKRNLNHDKSQPLEDGDASKPMETITMISNECIIIQDIMVEGDEATKFVPASEVVQSLVNEVNVVEGKSDTNENKEDQRNLNHDEYKPAEDGDMSEATEIKGINIQDIMEEGDENTKFVPASKIESLVNEVNGARDEVNVVEEKSVTNKNEDQRNLIRDESQPVEDGNVSESTEIISMVSNECINMQDIMELADEVTKFVPASDIESPVNEVNGGRGEVNVVEAKSDTNKYEGQRNLTQDECQPVEDGKVSESTEDREEATKFVPASEVVESPVNEVNVVEENSDTNKNDDQRNLKHEESQPVEDGNVSESKEIISMVSNESVIMQDIMEVEDEVTKFVPAFEIESLVNEVSDTRDEVNAVEAKSDTNKYELPRNLNHDECQPLEEGNVSKSTKIISMVSNECIIMQDIMEEGDEATKSVPIPEVVESSVNEVTVVEAESDTNKNEDQRNLNHGESQPVKDENVSESTEIINMVANECVVMQDIIEMEDEVTKLEPTSEIVEPCQTHSVDEDGLVSEKLMELPTSLNGECEYDKSNLLTDGYGVVLYNSDKSSIVSDERAIVMLDMMEVKNNKIGGVVTKVVSASEIIESCQAHSGAEEDILVSTNTLLQNTAGSSAQQEVTTLQPQDCNDKLNSMSISGNDQLHNPEILLKEPVERQVNTDVSCNHSSAATELPQNIEQIDEHGRTSSDSETSPTDAVSFKLFGKIIIPSSAEKHDLIAKENGEIVTSESPRVEELGHEQVVDRGMSKRRVSEPKYLKDYFRFK